MWPENSPADELDRLQAERRRKAERQVHIAYALTCIPYVASWFAGLWPGATWHVFLTCVSIATVFAIATGIVVFRNWSMLSWRMRLYGLAPWIFFAGTALLYLVVML